MPGKMKAGSYAAGTKAQLQGKAENKTVQDIKHLADGSGRENIAVRKVMKVGEGSYEDFLSSRKTPEGQKRKAEYEAKNRLGSLSDRDYASRVFAESQQDLKTRANKTPATSLVGQDAAGAATKVSTMRAMSKGNYAQPEGGAVVTSKTQAQFYADQSNDGTSKVAPGAQALAKKPVSSKAQGVAAYKDGAKKMKVGKKC